MSERPFTDWTLRELFSSAEVTLRELQAHCQSDLLPAYRQLSERLGERDAAQRLKPEALHALAERLSASQQFANDVHTRLSGMLQAITLRVGEELNPPPDL